MCRRPPGRKLSGGPRAAGFEVGGGPPGCVPALSKTPFQNAVVLTTTFFFNVLTISRFTVKLLATQDTVATHYNNLILEFVLSQIVSG